VAQGGAPKPGGGGSRTPTWLEQPAPAPTPVSTRSKIRAEQASTPRSRPVIKLQSNRTMVASLPLVIRPQGNATMVRLPPWDTPAWRLARELRSLWTASLKSATRAGSVAPGRPSPAAGAHCSSPSLRASLRAVKWRGNGQKSGGIAQQRRYLRVLSLTPRELPARRLVIGAAVLD
jgi:hypothetical protein